MKPPPKFIRVFLIEENERDAKTVSDMLLEEGGGQFIMSGVFLRLDEALCGLETGGGVDVILVNLPADESRRATLFSHLLRAAPDQPILALSGSDDGQLAVEAVCLGAQDCLLKQEMTGRLLVRSIQYAIERKYEELEATEKRDDLEKKVGELSLALANVNQRLSAALDQLSATQSAATQQDRLHAMERMAGGIAHDFNNALSPILAHSEWLLRKPGALTNEMTLRKALCDIHDSAGHCAEVVLRLRQFCRARDEFDPFEPLDLCEVAQRVIDLTQPSWKDQAQARGCHIVVETHFSEVPMVQGAREDLVELFANLILNAVDAIPEEGVISVSIGCKDGRVVVSISDNGVGMSEEVGARCMEPFFTTKKDQEMGKGLGLGVIYGIAQRHNAEINIESWEGDGTKVTLDFPTVPERAPGPEKSDATTQPTQPMRGLRILAVEDEPNIREIIGIYLTEDGHSVELAADGADALGKFEKGRFDLLLTDYSMPNMSGDRLAAAIRASDPKIRVALLTGFGSQMPQGAPLRLEVDAIISKPFTFETLRQGIAEAMEGGRGE